MFGYFFISILAQIIYDMYDKISKIPDLRQTAKKGEKLQKNWK